MLDLVGIVDFSQEVMLITERLRTRPKLWKAKWLYMTDSVADLLGARSPSAYFLKLYLKFYRLWTLWTYRSTFLGASSSRWISTSQAITLVCSRRFACSYALNLSHLPVIPSDKTRRPFCAIYAWDTKFLSKGIFFAELCVFSVYQLISAKIIPIQSR